MAEGWRVDLARVRVERVAPLPARRPSMRTATFEGLAPRVYVAGSRAASSTTASARARATRCEDARHLAAFAWRDRLLLATSVRPGALDLVIVRP